MKRSQPERGVRRRAFVLASAAAALAAAPAHAHEPAPTRLRKARTQAAVAGDDSERRFQQLVAQGEAALAQGLAEQAVDRFELAAGIRHAAPSELGLVRAWMQQGQYRRALAFVAHAAGVHRDMPAGSALHAWLLHVGGQPAFALRTLDSALERSPADPVLMALRLRLQQPEPVPTELLLQPPVRLAPYAVPRPGTEALPASLQTVCTALWVSPSDVAVPLAALGGVDRGLWLRDGGGGSFRAVVVRRDVSLGLALLSIDPRVPQGFAARAALTWAARDAFPGSQAFAFEHGAGAGWTNPEWPVMRSGFVGRFEEGRGYALEVDLRFSGPSGATVFDAHGRVIGQALRRDGAQQLVPASALRAWLGTEAVAPPLAPRRLAHDEVYEHGLALTAQVLMSVA